MGIRDIDELDLKLLLLSGSPIKVDNLEIVPYTFEQIKNYGYTKYMRNLQWISLSVDDFIKSVFDIEKRMYLETEKANLKTFDFYIKLGGQEMLDSLLVALSMIFMTEDIRVLNDKIIAINFEKLGICVQDEHGEISIDNEKLEATDENKLLIIHRDNFDEIVEVIKLQNYLMKPRSKDKLEEVPADEATRLLMEQMKKNEEKVQEVKKRQAQARDEDDSDIDIFDIISSVSTKSNSINKLNIWALTLYQLYDEYARLELIDNYDFSIKAMMAGAEKIDIKHWSSKI